MTSWPNVAVVGAGAVGSFFGGMLARAGAPVTFFGRPRSASPHLAAIRQSGLVIAGNEIRETIEVGVADSYSALERTDLVLLAVKSLHTAAAATSIGRRLRPQALVVSLQNGIENVEVLAAAGIEALPSVVFVAAAIESPGEVRHRGRGDLVIGTEDAGRRPLAERVAGWFEAAGVPCPVSDHIRREQWIKLVINSMANAVSALTDAGYRQLVEFEPTWRLAREVAREAGVVAAAEGTEIDLAGVIESARQIATSVGNATSSTQQDIARGRRTEIDALNGYIARRGAELGVPTPINEALFALVALRERARR